MAADRLGRVCLWGDRSFGSAADPGSGLHDLCGWWLRSRYMPPDELGWAAFRTRGCRAVRLALAAIFLATGCSSITSEAWRYLPPEGAPAVRWRGHTIRCPAGAPPDRVDRLAVAVQAQVEAFERDELGHDLPPTTFALSDAQWFTFPSRGAQQFAGMSLERDLVLAWTGGEDADVPVVYHELAHVCFAWGDWSHQDPRWPRWNAAQAAITAALRAVQGARPRPVEMPTARPGGQ